MTDREPSPEWACCLVCLLAAYDRVPEEDKETWWATHYEWLPKRSLENERGGGL